jgi:hypothetical protein
MEGGYIPSPHLISPIHPVIHIKIEKELDSPITGNKNFVMMFGFM